MAAKKMPRKSNPVGGNESGFSGFYECVRVFIDATAKCGVCVGELRVKDCPPVLSKAPKPRRDADRLAPIAGTHGCAQFADFRFHCFCLVLFASQAV